MIHNVEASIEQAVADGKLTPAAAANVRAWLTESRYADYAAEVAAHVADGKWQQLDDVFWTVIPFGTGGRRGRMYPIGTNAINDRTIGESAQGLADYVKQSLGAQPAQSCAIAYDTRHRSPEFARLCAEIMVAAGFQVFFLEGFRSTPELSFAVRYKNCSCGIMVTASHNPPSDNAVKVYWSTGGQLLPPHDQGVIERVMNIGEIERVDFHQAQQEGGIVFCQDDVDAAFQKAVLLQATPGPRDLRIVYSPLHGVGASAVCPILKSDGFSDVEVFAPHAEPDGDFPNVPGHVSNPENPAVFDSIIKRAREVGADIAVVSDPDCDRIGCAAPLTFSGDAAWKTLTGNQIGALLTDFVLENWRQSGRLTPDHYIVETLVTTGLIKRIGDSYGVRTIGDLLVGFKWIAGVIDDEGPERFVFGAEESHGYLAGTHVRDKDGAVAALLLSELAAKLKAAGRTLHEKLDALMWQHGAHAERTQSVQMPGSEGMDRMQEVMALLRRKPPGEIGGLPVARLRDYFQQTMTPIGGLTEKLSGPRGDLIILDLVPEGNFVAIRPSGTEPKIKFYMFAFEPAEQLSNLDSAKELLDRRLTECGNSLQRFAAV
jgi:phosphoglucomutase/phosphomannomutase